jgi:hypothetical protein
LHPNELSLALSRNTRLGNAELSRRTPDDEADAEKLRGMNAWCAATYERFLYAECKSPQLMRVALTSAGKPRPMLDAESFDGYELFE